MADDEPETREVVCRLFADRFDVIAVKGGRQALAVLGSRSVDVVLLDLLLPELDGLAVLEHLAASGCQAPVIVLSGIVHAEVIVAAMRLGAVDYVTKPLDSEHLLSAVETAGRRRNDRPRTRSVFVLGTDAGHRAALAVALGGRFDVRPARTRDTLGGSIEREDFAAVVIDVRDPAGPADVAALLETVGSAAPTFIVADTTAGVSGPAGAAIRIYRRPLKLWRLVEEIAGLAGRPPAAPGLSTISAQVVRGVEFVGARFRDAHVQAVADAVGVSAGHLSRLFRHQLAMGVKEFVDSVRLEVACHLLAETDAKVQAVARQAGFYDASHLSRVLRRRGGVSPGSLRAS